MGLPFGKGAIVLRMKPGCMLFLIFLFALAGVVVAYSDATGTIPESLRPAMESMKANQPEAPADLSAITKQAPPQNTPTPAATITPSIDYQATSIHAQETSQSAEKAAIAAQVELIAITAANEALHAQETISANDKAIAEANAQALSIQTTQTAHLTSFPATASQQAVNNTLTPAAMTQVSSQLTGTAQAPLLIIAQNNADSWWITFYVSTFALIALGVFMIGLGAFLIRKPAILAAQSARADEEFEQEERQREDSQFEKEEGTESDSFVRIDPNIPAPLSELLMLANGILDRELTLVFRDWGRTPVYQYLKDLRLFLKRNRMADSIPGGELIINTKGREFLRDSRVSGFPPPPYRCAL